MEIKMDFIRDRYTNVSAYDYTQCNPNTEEWYVTLELTTTDGYDEFRTTNLSSEGWNWVSFPVMDPDYSDPIQHVLTPILNDLEEVRYKNFYIRETTPGNWTKYHWRFPQYRWLQDKDEKYCRFGSSRLVEKPNYCYTSFMKDSRIGLDISCKSPYQFVMHLIQSGIIGHQ